MEIWKDITDYEKSYQVSSYGRIRSKTKKVMCKGNKYRTVESIVRKPQYNRKGYEIVVLSQNNKLKTFTVHQLVAQAFLPNFQKGTELNHKDGDPKNNKITNLEVSNPSHNQFHAVRNGLVKPTGKSSYRYVYWIRNPRAKARWACCIRHAGKSSYGWKTFHTEIEAARYADQLLDAIGDTQRLRNFPPPKCPTTIPQGSRIK